MGQTVRAVYERGQLRLLEKVALVEGQEVNVAILSDHDLIRAALGDLLVKPPRRAVENDDIDEEALWREIEAEITDNPQLSEAIIEERREEL
jgi:predicted DNA-binding antitoxin AbrB/MazE fold protein